MRTEDLEIGYNAFEAALNCLVLGKCKSIVYEYTMYLNNEELKADYCSTNFFGVSCCRIGSISYNNVEYTSEFLQIKEEKSDIYLLHPIGIVLILFFTFFQILKIISFLFVKKE